MMKDPTPSYSWRGVTDLFLPHESLISEEELGIQLIWIYTVVVSYCTLCAMCSIYTYCSTTTVHSSATVILSEGEYRRHHPRPHSKQRHGWPSTVGQKEGHIKREVVATRRRTRARTRTAATYILEHMRRIINVAGVFSVLHGRTRRKDRF